MRARPIVILTAASSLYGAAARWRRRWYARDPRRQRYLSRPVVSVGNLCAGGSGKTPVVEQIARLLVARGERPAILTRGYARRLAPDGVTVVSDGSTDPGWPRDRGRRTADARARASWRAGARGSGSLPRGPAGRAPAGRRRCTCWTMDFSIWRWLEMSIFCWSPRKT